MVPIVELRGAIPVAILLHDMNPILAFFCAVVGNLIPVPFIIIFIRKIFDWMRKCFPKLNKMIDRLEEKGKSKRETVLKYGFWGLFLFVAIPLPGTGAWTGALISILLGLKLRKCFLPIALGVVTAGAIMLTLSLTAKGLFEMLI